MTVAAVMLFASLDAALADTAGRPAARRMVESAWAGGATPIVVVSFDESGRLAGSLAGSPAVLAEPGPGGAQWLGQLVRGMKVAAEQVRETDAALVWPGQMVWVDAETVTTLIEAHGADRESLLRPSYGREAGWPVLVPMALFPELATLPGGQMPDEAIAALTDRGTGLRQIDTGDPGTVHDRETGPDELPTFEGPPEPVGGPAPEWGSAAAESSDEGPLAGPALAPYSQASEEGD